MRPAANNGIYQVYVRDMQTGTTALVSTGVNGAGNGQSYYTPAISADGRYVAFTSGATNLVPGGTNGGAQIFVRDLQTGSTTLASIGIGGQANRGCYDVSISADGRHLAFDSAASNLVAQPTDFVNNVYVSDWQTGTIALISFDSAGQLGNSSSNDPTISATGRYVSFDSYASNLADGDTNGRDDVFLRDLQTGITKRISVGSAGEGNSDSFYPSISADGRSIVFNSYADNLVSVFNVHNFGDVYLYFNPLAVADRIHITGDFNHDGTVDGTDYIVWRKGLGTTFSQSDYDDWRAHFGETTNSGGGLSLEATLTQPTFSVASESGEAKVDSTSTLEQQQHNARILDAPAPSSIEAPEAMSADDRTQATRELASEKVTTRTQAVVAPHAVRRKPLVNRHAHQAHASVSPGLVVVQDQALLDWLRSPVEARPKFDVEYQTSDWLDSPAEALSESEFDMALEKCVSSRM